MVYEGQCLHLDIFESAAWVHGQIVIQGVSLAQRIAKGLNCRVVVTVGNGDLVTVELIKVRVRVSLTAI